MAGWQDAPEVGAAPQPAWMGAPEMSAGPAKPMQPINMNRESGAGVRAMAGLKLGSEGQARYLEQRYGPGNVSTDKDGSFYVQEDGQWHPVDSPDFNAKDIADLSGTAIAAAPAIAATTVGLPVTALGTAAVGLGTGLGGSLLQQAVGALTPGGDPMSLEDRAIQTGIDTGAGMVSELGGRGLSRLASAPKNIYATQTGKAATPVANEGQAVEKFLGTGLSPGQISQRRSLLTLEGALRRSPYKAADMMADMDARQLAAARARWDELLDRIHASPQSAELLGGQVTKAFDDTVKTATGKLDRQAAADFAVVHSAAGKQPIFDLTNATGAIDGLLQQYDVPGAAADATKGLVRQLRSLRDSMTNTEIKPGGFMGMEPQRVTTEVKRSAEDMQRLLSSWGRAAAGKQKMFPDLDNRENVSIAKRVFGALNDDLSAATSVDPAVAGALQKARANYKTNIGAVEDIRKTAIGRYLGATDPGQLAPEQIAATLQRMKPSQQKQTFALLNSADPELAGATKRYVLQNAMDVAQPSAERLEQAAGMGVTPEAYSPARLMSGLVKSDVMQILEPDEKFAVHQLNSAFARLANRGGTEGSPTAPLMWAMDVAKNLLTAGATMDLIGGAKLAASIMAPNKLAEVITKPGATRALITLTQPNATREATIGAMTTLGLMGASRASNGQDVRPDAMPGQPGR